MTKKPNLEIPATENGPAGKSSTDAVLDAACLIAKAIQPSLGQIAEIVVHDFRDLKQSVVGYEGNLTGRKVGAPVTPLSLEIIAGEGRVEVLSDRLLTLENGQLIKSTVVGLKNAEDRLVGSFCLNLDLSNLRRAMMALEGLLGSAQDANPYTFPDNLPELVTSVMAQEEVRLGRPLVGLDSASRQSVVASLEEHRIFAIRNSARIVAQYLGISRATLYSDIEKIRNQSKA